MMSYKVAEAEPREAEAGEGLSCWSSGLYAPRLVVPYDGVEDSEESGPRLDISRHLPDMSPVRDVAAAA